MMIIFMIIIVMILIKINRNSKEKQITSKPQKKENATTKVTKTYTQK